MVMERLKIILPIILLFSLTVSFAYANITNLIQNGSVEIGADAPEHWFAGANTIWENQGHYGIHSLGLSTSASSGDWRCQSFTVTAKGNYSFSVYVKGNITTDLFRFKIRWFSNPDGTGFISENYIPIRGSLTDWKQINATVQAPSNAKSADVMFESLSGSGHVLADDFVMVPIDVVPETPEPIIFLQELFYGSGYWMMLIVLLAIIIIVSTLFPYGGIFFLPVTIFLGFDYMNKISASSNFMWGALMMIFASIYVLLMAIRKTTK
jgi:hypothetical protein